MLVMDGVGTVHMLCVVIRRGLGRPPASNDLVMTGYTVNEGDIVVEATEPCYVCLLTQSDLMVFLPSLHAGLLV